VVDEPSVAARLDARAAPDAPTLRERWSAAFGTEDTDTLVEHLHGLNGSTIMFRRPQLFLRARRAA
jgi:hypothetical protein